MAPRQIQVSSTDLLPKASAGAKVKKACAPRRPRTCLPARGYRRFRRNGKLNVAPHGENIITSEENKNSPFLKLPAELRNKIYNYALGDYLIDMKGYSSRKNRVYKIQSIGQPAECCRYNPFNLLRVCRQVYVETHMYPHQLSKFCYGWVPWSAPRPSTGVGKRLMRPWQWASIKTIGITAFNGKVGFGVESLLPQFQGLEVIQIRSVTAWTYQYTGGVTCLVEPTEMEKKDIMVMAEEVAHDMRKATGVKVELGELQVLHQKGFDDDLE
ncbi:hypothetical protein P154DRAFT_605626 [Amniculicola lignicola CBS 123094]|uniref:2EXR domain-containing protein n=1 Tax=Amniculicola lignicola CBS 123094 TaxID=1392246 RepID=A0A6A5WE57_9PLEO|nr:hypothetical protein P154DRAFT_605626 [Amniculicola lignicola CBS 123094]